MRRRSNTIYATSVESYLEASLKENRNSNFSPYRGLIKQGQRMPFCNKTIHNDLFENPGRKETNLTDVNWENFDFSAEKPSFETKLNLESGNSGVSSITLSENTADTDLSEEVDQYSLKGKTIVKKIMVIGLNNIGKRSLIKSVFGCDDKLNPKPNSNVQFDLILKTDKEESDHGEIKYQFWIRNLPSEEKDRKKYEKLIKTYYKNISIFIFVYSITNKESLDCLNEVIDSISKEIPSDKFTMALIGTQNDNEKERKVSFFDGISLQEKQKITFFIETNNGDFSLKKKLLKLMDEHENAEEIEMQKKNSVLSID